VSKQKGLPTSRKMRHDFHFVENLTARKNDSIGRLIPIEKIDLNPSQPREQVGDLTDLVSSIKEKGVLEPVLVSPRSGRFQIIAGERRYRASLKAGLSQLPCIEVDADEKGILEISLIENLQRKDLTVKIPRPVNKPHKGDVITFHLLGAENPNSIRGLHLDGVVLDEFAEMDPTVWSQVVRPTISVKKGFVIFIGTPKGNNHFYKIYRRAMESDAWFCAMLKASETGVIDAEELALAREDISEEEYDQEYECSFSAGIVGAYFSKYVKRAEKDKRIGVIPYDPALGVETWWDLEINDKTSIWFIQNARGHYRVIDYLSNTGMDLGYYYKELNKKEYGYSYCNLPHDANARELGTGKTRVETLRGLGMKNIVVHPRHDKADQIHASRMIFAKCMFDAAKCDEGLEALKNYKQKWDAKNKTFLDKPLHNWASNGADAFHLFALGVREDRIEDKRLPAECDTSFDLHALN